jgi:phosphoribosylformylglycinamidine synthase
MLHPLYLERQLIERLVDAAERGLIRSAHDISEGGAAITLAEACFNLHRIVGADVAGLQSNAELFGEGPSSVIISAPSRHLEELKRMFEPLEIAVLGRVTEQPKLKITPQIDEDVNELLRIYEESLARRLDSNG